MELAILLSTYNSESFIKAQLESLLSQTYKDWILYVRDDQSTDATPQILRQYADNDSRIHVLPDGEKRGARDGFMWLIQKINSDFYMFCDHDDVWLPQKIEKSVSLMLKQPDWESTPIIVCTNTKLVDSELLPISDSYWEYKCYRENMFADKYYHLFYNNILGCTMLFNRKTRNIAIPYPHDTAMHDSWIAVVTLWKKGRIIPIKEPLMLYRQHDGNTIGAPQMPSLFKQLNNFTNLWKKTSVQHHASRQLVKMPFPVFFLLKVWYMLLTHWRAFHKKNNL